MFHARYRRYRHHAAENDVYYPFDKGEHYGENFLDFEEFRPLGLVLEVEVYYARADEKLRGNMLASTIGPMPVVRSEPSLEAVMVERKSAPLSRGITPKAVVSSIMK